MDELTNSLPRTYYDLPPKQCHLCQLHLRISFSSMSTKTGFNIKIPPPKLTEKSNIQWMQTAIRNQIIQLVFQLINSIPTIQIIPNFFQVFPCAKSKIYLEGMIQITPQPNPPTHFHAAINWMILIE